METYSLCNPMNLAALLRSPDRFLRARTRPDRPYFAFGAGPFRVHVLTCPHVAQRVLQDQHASLRHGLGTGKMRRITGDGVLTSAGARHQEHRAMLAPLFAKWQEPGWVPELEDIVDRHLAALDGAVAMEGKGRAIALEIVLRLLFGAEGSASGARVDALIQDLAQSFATPFVFRHRFERKAERIRAEIARVVSGFDPEGPLHRLFPPGLAEREKTDHVVSLFIAGTDTLGWAFAWTAALLARHPAWARDTSADAARWIAAESLRLYPTVWLIARTATAPIALDEARLAPPDSRFVAPLTILHRHPAYWKDPDVFDPGRFRAPGPRPRLAYAPFGIGGFSCVGQRLATAALEAFVRRLNAGYDLTPVGGMPGTRGHVTLTSRGPVRLRLTKRHPNLPEFRSAMAPERK